MNTPLVSILVPCYNVEAYLPKCLDTIIGQTYQNLQVVLIDDGSKDGTWNVIQEYAAKDSRLEIYHQENQGVSPTRNHLLEKVKGEYVLFVDSDDWIELEMVEFLMDQIQENDADVAMCSNVINDTPVRKEYAVKIYDKDTTIREFLFHNELRGSLCNKLVKASLLHNIKFQKEIWYGEDALFCWHFFQNVDKVVLTDRQLYHYRMVDSSLCHSFGLKKLTGHETWRIITEETSRWWPQYLKIAQARWGMEDMYLLRQAGQSGYKKDSTIILLQNTVNLYLPQMKSTNLLVGREIFNAHMMCRWFDYGKLYSRLNRLKSLIK